MKTKQNAPKCGPKADKRRKKRELLKKTGSVIVTVVLVALCLYFALSLVLGINVGINAFVILTGSMEPKIPVGSMIIVVKTDFHSLEKGDIISAKADLNLDGKNEVVTHNFFKYEEIDGKKYIRTIAEGENFADSWVISEDRLIGKCVLIIPKVGKITSFLSHPIGLTVIAGNIVVLSVVMHYLRKEEEEENCVA